MKFLVISRPNGNDHGLSGGYDVAENINNHNDNLKALLADNTIEAAYAFISGGATIIMNANSTKELAIKVRNNPLFKSSHTEVIPVADAVDFLEGVAEYIS